MAKWQGKVAIALLEIVCIACRMPLAMPADLARLRAAVAATLLRRSRCCCTQYFAAQSKPYRKAHTAAYCINAPLTRAAQNAHAAALWLANCRFGPLRRKINDIVLIKIIIYVEIFWK
ncbi:hypothetical protein NPIL_540601 [Nephila pilipes]|uniref:Secreted protein n=1 Tax=Nephila pilipes TaxID=299642 RepID=A0A8X6PNB8_NEPPI|nr:hypothetical protein NPIL_540601 [Nephila pilipes]